MTPRATVIATYDDLLTQLTALIITVDPRIPVGATLSVLADMAVHAGLLTSDDLVLAVMITETRELARRNVPPGIEDDALAQFLAQAEELAQSIEAASA